MLCLVMFVIIGLLLFWLVEKRKEEKAQHEDFIPLFYLTQFRINTPGII